MYIDIERDCLAGRQKVNGQGLDKRVGTHKTWKYIRDKM